MTGTYLGMPAFPEAAKSSTRDTRLRANLTHATHTIRDKRARAVAELDDWAQLREAGKQIKDRTLRRLVAETQDLRRYEPRGNDRTWAAAAHRAGLPRTTATTTGPEES